jgi:2-polyprenyl-6-hydroxyphenyl methylase/3-demethylubiquinone-9 3-methyltransferase
VLIKECAGNGVKLEIRGIRPTVPSLLRWLVARQSPTHPTAFPRGGTHIVPTFSTAVLYQGRGTKGRGTKGRDTKGRDTNGWGENDGRS